MKVMRQLVKTIGETIGEVFKENESLSDIDLAYYFLLGVAWSTVKNLLDDFKSAAKEGTTWHTSRLKGLESKYSNRQVSDKLVEELTMRTLELLEHKIERAGDKLDDFDLELLDEQLYFQIGQYDFQEVINTEYNGKQCIVSGRIVKTSYRSSGNKKFAYLTIQDYKRQKMTVLVSSTFFSDYEKDLEDSKGKYLAIIGKVSYDNYLKTLIIRAYELDIITGYHIPRVPIKSYINV